MTALASHVLLVGDEEAAALYRGSGKDPVPPLDTHLHKRITVAAGSVLEFRRRRFQGFFRGDLLALKRLRSGAVSFRFLVTHWNAQGVQGIPELWHQVAGNTTCWVGERAILKVLPTTKGEP